VCGKESARLGYDAILELRVAHKRGALHRMAALVVVDTGVSRCIDQDFGDLSRGSLRGAQDLDEGHEQWYEERYDEPLHKAHEGVDVASPETGSWIEARFDRVDVQSWNLTGEC
jgi:hypothetical protein